MKTLIISLIAILPLLSSAQDTTIMGGYMHISKPSKNVDKVANYVIWHSPDVIDKTTIPDSLHRFNILIGQSAYQLTDTSKWVILDTAATLATLLEFVITMQHSQEYQTRLWQKLNAAYNILRLINVNGYVRKKDMPEFIKARDAYIKLNNEKP